MAGGTFITQNKVRPGAYVNMIAKAKASSSIANRGVVAVPVSLNWGAEARIIRVTAEDIINGSSIAKIGTDGSDADALAVQLAFLGASEVLFYRTNVGGDEAEATLGNLACTAKYSGTAGNRISVAVIANGAKFDVVTYFDGKEKDKQTVSAIADLVDNDFVSFSGTGDLAATTATLLEDGTNGSASATAYTDFLAALDSYNFNCVAMTSTTAADITAAITKVKAWRNDYGKYVQAVIIDTAANDEGIISIKQSYKIGDTTVSKPNAAIYVASITAGAPVNQSNTYRILDGATELVDILSNDQIIEALKAGYFVFSIRQDGAIVVEQDINTLHTFGSDKNYAFKKNRVVRTLDEIARTICLDFEQNFIGKVTNDDNGRMIFKSSVMNILSQFADLGCIEAVPTGDVEVLAGEDIDSVVLNLGIKPLDSMEKLYTTITVR